MVLARFALHASRRKDAKASVAILFNHPEDPGGTRSSRRRRELFKVREGDLGLGQQKPHTELIPGRVSPHGEQQKPGSLKSVRISIHAGRTAFPYLRVLCAPGAFALAASLCAQG